MLNRLRARLERLSSPVARAFASWGAGPDALTISGLAIALLTPAAALLAGFPGILAAIAASSALDLLDGQVARILGRASKRGAFLDSLCDRVSDLAYIASFHFTGLDPLILYVAAGSSMLVSYSRARGESLGAPSAGVGLMERGERILGLLATALAGILSPAAAEVAMAVFAALTAYTAAERSLRIARALARG